MPDDRLRVLLFQLDTAWEMLEARLAGLTDDEYFWEPVPGCWSLRPRGQAASAMPSGKGEWLLDYEEPEPQPPPFTTIAWRMCHMAQSPLERYDYTFGSHNSKYEDVVWPSGADDAVRFLSDVHHRWRAAVGGLHAEELDTVGLSQYPGGLDPQVRFVDLLAWTNTDFLHHAAEVACLRDLYRAQGSRAASLGPE